MLFLPILRKFCVPYLTLNWDQSNISSKCVRVKKFCLFCRINELLYVAYQFTKKTRRSFTASKLTKNQLKAFVQELVNVHWSQFRTNAVKFS